MLTQPLSCDGCSDGALTYTKAITTLATDYVKSTAVCNFSRISLLLALMLFLVGCSSPTKRGHWGGGATLTPSWSKIQRAALNAASDPLTWTPTVGALFFYVGDLDRDLSNWAVEHRPLFGDNAQQHSDKLRDATHYAYLLTALIAPSGDSPQAWAVNKTKGLAVGLSTIVISASITRRLKHLTDKTRPSGKAKDSFPSSHASLAATQATLAAKSLDYIAMPDQRRVLIKTGYYSLAAGTAWARVEAEKHYPSDVLVSFALGNFMASFMNEAFLAPDSADDPTLLFTPHHKGLGLAVNIPF
jgi:membrane-associated phospholipid phosphatase